MNIPFIKCLDEITINQTNSAQHLPNATFVDIKGLSIKINTIKESDGSLDIIVFTYNHPILITPIRIELNKEKNKKQQLSLQYQKIVQFIQNIVEPICFKFAKLQAQ